jgi:hypothetical protein
MYEYASRKTTEHDERKRHATLRYRRQPIHERGEWREYTGSHQCSGERVEPSRRQLGTLVLDQEHGNAVHRNNCCEQIMNDGTQIVNSIRVNRHRKAALAPRA